jgi:sulfite reductase alpha subunit-like flavoprotein
MFQSPNTIEVRICEFLSDYVDLEQPFQSLGWMADFVGVSAVEFENIPVIETLVKIFLTGASRPLSSSKAIQMLQSMKPHQPRCYSTASSPIVYECSTARSSNASSTNLEILMRIIPKGRFSWQTLSESSPGTNICYKFQAPHPATQSLTVTEKSIVAVAVGTGFGPVRGIIQRRIKKAAMKYNTNRDGTWAEPAEQQGKITLFLGFKNEDSKIFIETVQRASAYNIFDAVRLVPSNKEQIRVQDCFLEWKELLARKLVAEKGWLHVCGSGEMVRGMKVKMEETLGNGFWTEIIGEGRLIEEDF